MDFEAIDDEIDSVEFVGTEETFDLTVDHPEHTFYADGVCVSNSSHSYSYAIDSFQCAYLMTYFEPEWLCSYLESQMGNADSRGEAIATVKSFGYKIGKVDINLSTDRWVIAPDNKTFVPPLLSVKGVGMSAVDEIVRKRPYTSLSDLLWDENGDWKHSKFNRKAMENLIKVGAFGSMELVGPPREDELPGGPPFGSWHQMHAVLVEGADRIKHKKKGHSALIELIVDTSDLEEWPAGERIQFYKELIGELDVDLVLDADVQERLAKRGVKSVDEMVEGAKDVAWFVATELKRLTTKTGKSYAQLVVVGASGASHRLKVWQAGPEFEPELNAAYIAEINKDGWGMSTSVYKVKKLG